MAIYRVTRCYGDIAEGTAKGAAIGAGIGAAALPGLVAGMSKTNIGKEAFKAAGIPKLTANHYLRAAGRGALTVGALGAGIGLVGSALSNNKDNKQQNV